MPNPWAPFAEKRPVALRSSQRRITPVGLVCHTAVLNATVATPTGTTRWHFYMGKTGKLYQFFPVNVAASCQLHGNYWLSGGKPYGFVSCESWDGAWTSLWPNPDANPSGGPAWTEQQMESWGILGAWLHTEWGVYLGKATAPRGKGIGQHSDFTGRDPEIRWNTTHACVGTKRKAQMNEVRRRMNVAATPAPSPEDDVTPEDIEKIAQRAAELVWKERLENPIAAPDAVPPYASSYLIGLANKMDVARGQVSDLTALPGALSQVRAEVEKVKADVLGEVANLNQKLDDLIRRAAPKDC